MKTLKQAKPNYPFQNREMAAMRGERWKDIPGYEGYYQASNLGRIKSLDRIIPHPRLYYQTVAGRILSQKAYHNFNSFTGDKTVYLQVSLNLEAKASFHNVRRLVWAAFRGPIGDNIILNKDGDGLNNRLSNLIKAEYAEKQRRTIRRGRIDFHFLKTVDRSNWKKNMCNAKPVRQLDMKGREIMRFESISAAAVSLHMCAKGISHTLRGDYPHWRGFKWEFI